MQKHAKQLHVRMSAEEIDRTRRLADELGMTVSDLVRILVQLPASALGQNPESLIVVDRNTAIGLRRELRRWGHHYNQAVHALNAISYYLRLDEADAADALEELEKVSRKLESMDGAVSRLREEVAEISAHPIAFS